MTSASSCMAKSMLDLGRFILFLSCLCLTISQLASLIPKEPEAESGSSIAHCEEDYHFSYLNFGFTLIVYVLGLFGAITREPKCLFVFTMTFVVVSVFNGAIFCASYKTMTSVDLEQRLSSAFRSSSKDYVWYQTGANRATRLWDETQETLKCCGLKGRFEWDDLRPNYLAQDVLPGSCCKLESRARSFGGRCHFEDAFEQDCESAIHATLNLVLMYRFASIVYHLTLAFLAIGIAKFEPQGFGEPATSKSVNSDSSA